MTSKFVQITVATAAALSVATPAQAALPKPVRYQNCAALNAVYKHGVAKEGGTDKVKSGKPVTTFLVYQLAYLKNTHLDRDRDGVACEKK
jgi:excalibur calcium-binding domain-containing protein